MRKWFNIFGCAPAGPRRRQAGDDGRHGGHRIISITDDGAAAKARTAVAAVNPTDDLPDRIAQLEGQQPARRARWRWLLAGATLANLAALTAAAMCCAALGRVMTGVMT